MSVSLLAQIGVYTAEPIHHLMSANHTPSTSVAYSVSCRTKKKIHHVWIRTRETEGDHLSHRINVQVFLGCGLVIFLPVVSILVLNTFLAAEDYPEAIFTGNNALGLNRRGD